MSSPNWIDKLVGYFSPQAGLKRQRARLAQSAFEKLQRGYEGASTGRRTEGWAARSSSSNVEIAKALPRLRDRSRDLCRNNPYAARAKQVIVSNTVGTGILPRISARSKARAAAVMDLWKKWGDSTECDFDGRYTIYGLQSLAFSTVVESGEVLIRRRRVPSGPTIPMKLQVLEPDFIDSNMESLASASSNGNYIIQGVEFDSSGRRVAYWIFNEHPGGALGGRVRSYKSERVPVEDIIHVFRTERPGQIRGVPWVAPVIILLKDLDEMMDATLLKQKISAAFAAFVTDVEGGLEASGEKASIGEKIEPAIIEVLPPGKSISFAEPPSAADFPAFTKAILQAISVGYGVTYEGMTGDLSRVNFSSGRMGWLEFQRNIDQWRWQILIPQMCNPTWRWFLEAVELSGSSLQGNSVEAAWTPPRREMIDPGKEIGSMRDAIRAGLQTLSESHRQLGYDSDEVLVEMASDNQKLDNLGLVLDSDPRKVMKSGSKQMDEVAAPAEPEEEETETEDLEEEVEE